MIRLPTSQSLRIEVDLQLTMIREAPAESQSLELNSPEFRRTGVLDSCELRLIRLRSARM